MTKQQQDELRQMNRAVDRSILRAFLLVPPHRVDPGGPRVLRVAGQSRVISPRGDAVAVNYTDPGVATAYTATTDQRRFLRGGKSEAVWSQTRDEARRRPGRKVAIVTAAGTFTIVYRPNLVVYNLPIGYYASRVVSFWHRAADLPVARVTFWTMFGLFSLFGGHGAALVIEWLTARVR